MFAIIGQRSSELDVIFGKAHTETISFPPALVHAQVSLSFVGAFSVVPGNPVKAATSWTEITQFTHRPIPDGVDETVKVPKSTHSFVGAVERMTTVTWVVDAGGGDSLCRARIDLFWWGDVSVKNPVPFMPVQIEPGLGVVLYGTQAGDIRHVHHETALAGVRPLAPAQAERRALALARSLEGADLASVKALVVPGATLRSGKRLRVDVTQRRLVDAD